MFSYNEMWGTGSEMFEDRDIYADDNYDEGDKHEQESDESDLEILPKYYTK